MGGITIIAGTPNPASRLAALLRRAEAALTEDGIAVAWIHAAALPPEDLIGARFDSPAVTAANRLVEEADAVIIGSPVYKASYSGVLKTYLDLLPRGALAGKPVLPVFVGGSAGHRLVIDYALKPVLAALGARCQLAGVYAVDAQIERRDAGGCELDPELEIRLMHSLFELASLVRQHPLAIHS